MKIETAQIVSRDLRNKTLKPIKGFSGVEVNQVPYERYKIWIPSQIDENVPNEQLPWARVRSLNSGLGGHSGFEPIIAPGSFVLVEEDRRGDWVILEVLKNVPSDLPRRPIDRSGQATSGNVPGDPGVIVPTTQQQGSNGQNPTEIPGTTSPSAEDDKQNDPNERAPESIYSACKKIDTEAINSEISNLIRDVENIRTGLIGEDSFLRTSQNFINNDILGRVSQASSTISQLTSNLIQEIRRYVIRKVNSGINDLTGNAPLSSRYLVNEAKDEALSLISCIFVRILSNLESLIYEALRAIIDAVLDTASCLIEGFISNFIGQLVAQITSAINAILGPISSLLGSVISFTSEILDFAVSILNALSCRTENICPQIEKWNPLEGPQRQTLSIDFVSVFDNARGIASQFANTINVGDDLESIQFNFNAQQALENTLNGCNLGPTPCGPPNVVFWGGNGSGATGNAVVNAAGDIIGVDIITPGNYTSSPIISFEDSCGNGIGAIGSPILGNINTSLTPTITFTSPTTPIGLLRRFVLRYRLNDYDSDREFRSLDLEVTNTATNRVINIPGINSPGSELPAGEDITHRLELTAVNGNDDPDFVDEDGVRSSRSRNFLVVDFPDGEDEVTFLFELTLRYRRNRRNRRVRATTTAVVSRASLTQPSWTITPDRTTIPEGDTVTFTIETPENVSDGTRLHYIIVGENITPADFVDNRLNSQSNTELGRRLNFGDLTPEEREIIRRGDRTITSLSGLTGQDTTVDPRRELENPRSFEIGDSVVVTNGRATITKTAARDTVRESSESFYLQIREGQIDGPILGNSPNITITDEPQQSTVPATTAPTAGAGATTAGVGATTAAPQQGVTGVVIESSGYNYLPSRDGSTGGLGRVWANRCQTVVRRANGRWDSPYSEGSLIRLYYGDSIILPASGEVLIDCDFSTEELPGSTETGTRYCYRDMRSFDDGASFLQPLNIRSMVGFDDIRGSTPENTPPVSLEHRRVFEELASTERGRELLEEDRELIRSGALPDFGRPDQFGFYNDYPYARELGFSDTDIRYYIEGFYSQILGKRVGPIMRLRLEDPTFGPIPSRLRGRGGAGVFDCENDYPYAISLGYNDRDIRYYLENYYTGEIDSCMQGRLNDPNWGRVDYYVELTAPGCPPEPTGDYQVVANISDVVVADPGFGYSPNDTATVLNCSGNPDSAARIQLNVDQQGRIQSATVLNPGTNFTCIPEIVLNTNSGFNGRLIPVMGFDRLDDDRVPRGTVPLQVVDCVGRV